MPLSSETTTMATFDSDIRIVVILAWGTMLMTIGIAWLLALLLLGNSRHRTAKNNNNTNNDNTDNHTNNQHQIDHDRALDEETPISERLQIGDVVCFSPAPDSFVSHVICQLTGEPVSHAALVVDPAHGQIAEESPYIGAHYGYLHDQERFGGRTMSVLRLRNKDVSQNDPTAPSASSSSSSLQPVVDVAAAYVRAWQPYGFSQLYAIAMLLLTQQWTPSHERSGGWSRGPHARALYWIVRQVTPALVDWINRRRHPGKQPMFCSEFVYQCFHDAGPEYAIRLAARPVVLANNSSSSVSNAGGMDADMATLSTPENNDDNPQQGTHTASNAEAEIPEGQANQKQDKKKMRLWRMASTRLQMKKGMAPAAHPNDEKQQPQSPPTLSSNTTTLLEIVMAARASPQRTNKKKQKKKQKSPQTRKAVKTLTAAHGDVGTKDDQSDFQNQVDSLVSPVFPLVMALEAANQTMSESKYPHTRSIALAENGRLEKGVDDNNRNTNKNNPSPQPQSLSLLSLAPTTTTTTTTSSSITDATLVPPHPKVQQHHAVSKLLPEGQEEENSSVSESSFWSFRSKQRQRKTASKKSPRNMGTSLTSIKNKASKFGDGSISADHGAGMRSLLLSSTSPAVKPLEDEEGEQIMKELFYALKENNPNMSPTSPSLASPSPVLSSLEQQDAVEESELVNSIVEFARADFTAKQGNEPKDDATALESLQHAIFVTPADLYNQCSNLAFQFETVL